MPHNLEEDHSSYDYLYYFVVLEDPPLEESDSQTPIDVFIEGLSF